MGVAQVRQPIANEPPTRLIDMRQRFAQRRDGLPADRHEHVADRDLEPFILSIGDHFQ